MFNLRRLTLALGFLASLSLSSSADPKFMLNDDEKEYRNNAACCDEPWKACCSKTWRDSQGRVRDLDGSLFRAQEKSKVLRQSLPPG